MSGSGCPRRTVIIKEMFRGGALEDQGHAQEKGSLHCQECRLEVEWMGKGESPRKLHPLRGGDKVMTR